MVWTEINHDDALWVVPKARVKGKKVNTVPLSSLALEILNDCPRGGDHVFASGLKRPVGEDIVKTVALNGWGKSKKNLDIKAAKIFRELVGDKSAKIPEWHLHDLRRTTATLMSGVGVDRFVKGKILNHADNSVTSTYDRHDYLPEKSKALESWAQMLREIVGDSPPSNVIQLPRMVG
jgi:integrase